MPETCQLCVPFGARVNALSKLDKTNHESGCLVLIVGPSGSGKDTLINWLKGRIGENQRFLFVKRTVTRTADAGSEDHDTLSAAEFETAKQAGEFAVTWQAHELSYGIPSEVRTHVAAGGIAIANGSRRALKEIEAAFDRIVVIQLTVTRTVLAKRLSERGRETADQIEKRLDQSSLLLSTSSPLFKVDNSTDIEAAGNAVLELILNNNNTPRSQAS